MEAAYFEAPAQGGSRQPQPGEPGYSQKPEPMINAPVAGGRADGVDRRPLSPADAVPFVADALAFSPRRLLEGDYIGLVTSQFLHGSWSHALMNAAFVLAFGAPVARFLGARPSGVAGFLLFYLLCGVLAALGFAAVNWGQAISMVGASGAASGLMGAAARLIGGQGRVGPLFSQAVTGMGGAWILINVIMAFTGGLMFPGGGDAGVAWEAHLAGFAAGVLLIGPFGWLAGRR